MWVRIKRNKLSTILYKMPDLKDCTESIGPYES